VAVVVQRAVRVTAPGNRANSAGSSYASLLVACAVLLVAIAPAAFITAAGFEGGISWRAALIAAAAGGVCYVAAAMSLMVTFASNQLGMPVHGLLLGMLFRMGLPLAAIISLSSQRTLGATIVVVYLLALIVETILALRLTPSALRMTPTKKPAPSNREFDLNESTSRSTVAS
jgi:hypothetical protein